MGESLPWAGVDLARDGKVHPGSRASSALQHPGQAYRVQVRPQRHWKAWDETRGPRDFHLPGRHGNHQVMKREGVSGQREMCTEVPRMGRRQLQALPQHLAIETDVRGSATDGQACPEVSGRALEGAGGTGEGVHGEEELGVHGQGWMAEVIHAAAEGQRGLAHGELAGCDFQVSTAAGKLALNSQTGERKGGDTSPWVDGALRGFHAELGHATSHSPAERKPLDVDRSTSGQKKVSFASPDVEVVDGDRLQGLEGAAGLLPRRGGMGHVQTHAWSRHQEAVEENAASEGLEASQRGLHQVGAEDRNVLSGGIHRHASQADGARRWVHLTSANPDFRAKCLRELASRKGAHLLPGHVRAQGQHGSDHRQHAQEGDDGDFARTGNCQNLRLPQASRSSR